MIAVDAPVQNGVDNVAYMMSMSVIHNIIIDT